MSLEEILKEIDRIGSLVQSNTGILKIQYMEQHHSLCRTYNIIVGFNAMNSELTDFSIYPKMIVLPKL